MKHSTSGKVQKHEKQAASFGACAVRGAAKSVLRFSTTISSSRVVPVPLSSPIRQS
jgi:hypothetical protein